MNNNRRKEIKKVIANIESIMDVIEEITYAINDIRDEEQDAFDNLPEGIQCSERGETMEECIEYLDDAATAFEDLDINSIIETLQECL